MMLAAAMQHQVHVQAAVVVTFLLYLALLMVIGWLGERKHSKSYEGFVAGGKKLGALVTALSSAASSESAWAMLGLSGLGFWEGTAALWAAIGCVVGFTINALFIVVQLKRASDKYNAITVSDYIEARFADKTGLLRKVSAAIITFFMTVYVVAQFTGSGKIISDMQLFGPNTSYELGVVVGAIIVGIYIFMGGYAAVCWTDTLQGLLMLAAMLGLPIYAFVLAGGYDSIVNSLGQQGLLNFWSPRGMAWASVGFIVGQLAIALGYQGMPHVIVRYITVRDKREAVKSAVISVIWSIIVLFGSTLLGIFCRALFYKTGHCTGFCPTTQKQAESVMPYFARHYLHPILAGGVLAAVTAAIMSTADSQLMYAATSLINDFWLKIRKNKAVDKHKIVKYTRIVIAAITLISMIIALLDIKLIYYFVLFAWSALGAAFTPIIVLGLYWKKFNKYGALACLIVGPAVSVIWYHIPALKSALYEMIPAVALSFASGAIVSTLTSSKTE